MSAICRLLPDGKRLHCHHGPIDLIIEADAAAYGAAQLRFATVLDELVTELPALRREAGSSVFAFKGSIAGRMADAVQPYWRERITPMAAVAGAVADEVLRVMVEDGPLRRAYVNNGGDIALHLAAGEAFNIASPSGKIVATAGDGVGGVATSGWRGRSYSLGIADAVTVLAATAAQADAAATMIGNAVDLPGSTKVKRQRACELAPESDLGERLVTVDVGVLSPVETSQALGRGVAYAQDLLRRGFIVAASLQLNGKTAYVADEDLKALHG